jgi:hypothetical protein
MRTLLPLRGWAAGTLLAAWAWGLLVSPVHAQVQPQPQAQPLRVSAGAELWSIPAAALQQFATAGTFSDQRLLRLVATSGWPDDALRAALLKPYAVDLVALARFLDSPAGQLFLQQQTRAYRPFRAGPGERDLRVPALRSAILAEAQGAGSGWSGAPALLVAAVHQPVAVQLGAVVAGVPAGLPAGGLRGRVRHGWPSAKGWKACVVACNPGC